MKKGRIRKCLAAIVAFAAVVFALNYLRENTSATVVYGNAAPIPDLAAQPEVSENSNQDVTQTAAVIPPIPLLFELQELSLAGADEDAAIIAESYIETIGTDEANRIADSYWNGGNANAIPELAVTIYKSLWKMSRNKHAAHRLGLAYFHGRGVIADAEQSLSYFEAPEIMDDRTSLYHRAILLADTEAAPEKRDKAQELLQRAAQLGYPPAITRLKSYN